MTEKGNKFFLKKLTGIVSAFFIFIIITNFLDYLYVSPDVANVERALWHNFYEDEGKIDNLYLGSSHVYFDINPSLLDTKNGQYNFNLASQAQLLNGSFYLLKEAEHHNELSHVYLELYYRVSTKDNFQSYADPIDISADAVKNWNNIDYMENSFVKLEYILAIANQKTFINIILPFARYRNNLDDWDYIRWIIGRKQDSNYTAYKYFYDFPDEQGYDESRTQGYVYSTKTLTEAERTILQYRILDENPMGVTSESYLRKIICFCQEKHIPITLFISPMDELALLSTEHYDNYINQVQQIADEFNISFYDFNLAKEEYFPIHQDQYFRDSGHLNYAGAEMYTSFFYETMSRNTSENKKYFYTSYEEKLQNTPPAIYGLYYRNSEAATEEETIRTYWIASNRNEEMEYKIILVPDESEKYIVQDFSENKEFIVTGTEHGLCTIISRMKDNPQNIQTLNVLY